MSMHPWPGFAQPPLDSPHTRVENPVWDPTRRTLTTGLSLLLLGALCAGLNACTLEYRPASGNPLTLATILCTACGGIVTVVALMVPACYNLLRSRDHAADVAWLSHSLADLLEMEVPLPQALERLGQDARGRFSRRYSRIAAALLVMAREVGRGSPLSQAAYYTGLFPLHWVTLCSAGERTGRLSESLRMLGRQEEARPVVATRFLYVAIVGALSLLLAFFLIGYVMPTFRSLLEGLRVPLPASTSMLLSLTRGGGGGVLGLESVALLVVFLVAAAWMMRPGLVPASLARTWLFSWQRVQEQSRAIEVVADATRMGMSSCEALQVASLASTSPEVVRWLGHASLDATCDLGTVLTRGPWVPAPSLSWLMAQGERFDNLPEALEAAARHLREEGMRQAERLLVSLDVILTAVSGLLAGFIVYATMQPLALLVGLLERVIVP